MKKGKTLTALVLVLEIATIAVLHAVKISQSEKTANKEISRTNAPEPADAKTHSTFTLTALR